MLIVCVVGKMFFMIIELLLSNVYTHNFLHICLIKNFYPILRPTSS